MTSFGDNRPARLIDEAEVRSILRRAAEFDAASYGMMTEAQLIEVAKEAGISSDSVRRALDEAQSRAPAAEPGLPWWARPMVAGVAGIVIGVGSEIAIGRAADNWMKPMIFVTLGSVAIGLLLLALRPGKKRAQVSFHLSNIAVWMGTVLGVNAAREGFYMEAELILAIGVCSIIGGAIVAFRSRRSRATPGSSAGTSASDAQKKKSAPWWKRWYASVKDLLVHVMPEHPFGRRQKEPLPAPNR